MAGYNSYSVYNPPEPYTGLTNPSIESVLYSVIDKKFWFFQPNFVRTRHRYRGPRESVKINQEVGQVRYDLMRLLTRQAEVDSRTSFLRNIMKMGWDLDENISYDWSTDATPVIQMASLIGLEDMSIRIERLRDRIKQLEK